jgi:ABC-type ATPase involved in cell division
VNCSLAAGSGYDRRVSADNAAGARERVERVRAAHAAGSRYDRRVSADDAAGARERVERVPVLVETIFRTIAEINREGTTILLVEQNAAMALQVASRGYVLESGTIAMEERAAVLRESDVVRRTYLGIE